MLETVWFALWGILWAVYFMLDGFDLGIGALIPALGRNDEDTKSMLNAIGPFWDGNEVWLITAGGVTFAAFPAAYAAMFSSLYTPLMLILFALIFRGVSIEFRNKIESPSWRACWDFCLTAASILSALLFGVAFANIFKGIPIDADYVLRGGLFALLNPYGLLGGFLFLAMFLHHGALWLAAKTAGSLHDSAAAAAAKIWPALFLLAAAFLAASAAATHLYDNYLRYPLLFIVPASAVAALVMSKISASARKWWNAWIASAAFIAVSVLFGVIGLYPSLIPSSIDPAFSLTAHNSASSPLTLKIMLAVALTFVPLVIAYQAWVFFTFSHKVNTSPPGQRENIY